MVEIKAPVLSGSYGHTWYHLIIFFNHLNFGFVRTVRKQCPLLEGELGSWKEPMAVVGGSQRGLSVCDVVTVSILKWDRCVGKDWKAIHQ